MRYTLSTATLMAACLFFALTSTSAVFASSMRTRRSHNHQDVAFMNINLSYRTNLEEKEITSLCKEQLDELMSSIHDGGDDDTDAVMNMNIDVSSCGLGESGIVNLLDSLNQYQNELNEKERKQEQEQQDEEISKPEPKSKPRSLSISLEARMNGLDGGAPKLFERIMMLGTSTRTHTNETEAETDSEAYITGHLSIESLDIGLNDIENGDMNKKATSHLHESLQKLIENQSGSCPRILRMDACGGLGALSCRAIGKGLINYYQHRQGSSGTKLHHHHQSLRKLYLSGNDCIGDGGTAALAAALKLSGEDMDVDANAKVNNDENNINVNAHVHAPPILETLDLSSCSVSDGGAGALAMAIECSPGCLTHLNLSNNQISDDGAIALARALKAGQTKLNARSGVGGGGKRNDDTVDSDYDYNYCMDSLDLSNNIDIGDDGAEALFDALACGAVRRILLRSCSIKACGAEALGVAIGKMLCNEEMRRHLSSPTSTTLSTLATDVEVDLSGNKLGTKKIKKKESVYSTKTVISGMNFLGNKLKSGLKDVGLSSMVSSSLESDDEAEMEDLDGGELPDLDDLPSQCGASYMYDGLKEALNDMPETDSDPQLGLTLGLRMCNFDDKGFDALAATCILAGEDGGARICIDCAMNKGAPENAVQTLQRGRYESQDLIDMAKAHLTSLKALQEARESAEAESRLNDFFSIEDEDFSGDEYDKFKYGNYDYDDSY